MNHLDPWPTASTAPTSWPVKPIQSIFLFKVLKYIFHFLFVSGDDANIEAQLCKIFTQLESDTVRASSYYCPGAVNLVFVCPTIKLKNPFV